jgi:hypothetical protein
MRMAAQLNLPGSIRFVPKIGGHDADGAAEKCERARSHARVFDPQQRGHACFGRAEQDSDGVKGATSMMNLGEFAAAEVFALRTPALQALLDAVPCRCPTCDESNLVQQCQR